mmetsp:Transcript_44972/g.51657  ORF Transcript_44972/g.51657 Transcript_44972/m.51657 type:complete len:341 (-) Transcript_44972:278-1300(-)
MDISNLHETLLTQFALNLVLGFSSFFQSNNLRTFSLQNGGGPVLHHLEQIIEGDFFSTLSLEGGRLQFSQSIEVRNRRRNLFTFDQLFVVLQQKVTSLQVEDGVITFISSGRSPLLDENRQCRVFRVSMTSQSSSALIQSLCSSPSTISFEARRVAMHLSESLAVTGGVNSVHQFLIVDHDTICHELQTIGESQNREQSILLQLIVQDLSLFTFGTLGQGMELFTDDRISDGNGGSNSAEHGRICGNPDSQTQHGAVQQFDGIRVLEFESTFRSNFGVSGEHVFAGNSNLVQDQVSIIGLFKTIFRTNVANFNSGHWLVGLTIAHLNDVSHDSVEHVINE